MNPTGPPFTWFASAMIAANAGELALVPPKTAQTPRNPRYVRTPPLTAELNERSGTSLLPAAETVFPSSVRNELGSADW